MTDIDPVSLRKPWFVDQPPPTRTDARAIDLRQLYYYLMNVEEHPEVLPLAYDFVTARLDAAEADVPRSDETPASLSRAVDSLDEVLEQLTANDQHDTQSWRDAADDLDRRQILHVFIQYLPTAMVDGCWLQGGLRVAMAHTPVGASLTGLYQHQVRAFASDPGRHFVADYRTAYSRLGAPLEEISSRSFAQRTDFRPASLRLPILLLAIGQFTRSFSVEILGLNLAWQFNGLSAFGPDLVQSTCRAYELPPQGDDSGSPDPLATGRDMARTAVVELFERADEAALPDLWARLLRGVRAGVDSWKAWSDTTRDSMPGGPPDPRLEMIELLRRKAPHAHGYHGGRRLGGEKLDALLAPETFDGPALLAALERSPWVSPGESDRSALLGQLLGFGGPMLSVFSPVEVKIIETWIDSLEPRETGGRPSRSTKPTVDAPSTEPPALDPPETETTGATVGYLTSSAELRRRSETIYRGCSVRQLYHYLINVEWHTDVLPLAERFARDRLERSTAMLFKGERPIPSPHYDPAALEAWVYAKHRRQVASYRPPNKRPKASKDAFRETTLQLAPLILIDGGWLQGVASPALIHTTVGRMLFHVLVEELGEGRPEEHHANIYRDLLTAMGLAAPPVETWDFANWSKLEDASFDVPTLWLSISCFPRHFLPEILGLNLAVELAGVGGPYMEARDTLRRFGYPTLFVDVHNAADNVSVGHAAWAMSAITRYMDDLAEREGPHSLDPTWHRVWSGVRATLPQIGRLRLLAHRVGERLFGRNPARVPRIFPS